eukprot:404328_1
MSNSLKKRSSINRHQIEKESSDNGDNSNNSNDPTKQYLIYLCVFYKLSYEGNRQQLNDRLKIHRHHQRLLVHGYCRLKIHRHNQRLLVRFIPKNIINYLTMGGDMNYEWFWKCPECRDRSWSIARK